MKRRLIRWMGFACLTLSALVAGLGFVAQAALTFLGGLGTMLVAIPIMAAAGLATIGPCFAAGTGVVGASLPYAGALMPVDVGRIDVPQVLPPALGVALLLLAIALACFAGLFRPMPRGGKAMRLDPLA